MNQNTGRTVQKTTFPSEKGKKEYILHEFTQPSSGSKRFWRTIVYEFKNEKQSSK